MRALTDTEGMGSPERAAFWLTTIATRLHRGPRRDTWTSARDRAAAAAGISNSMAQRIWQRWESMTDVSGAVMINLMVAYERICVANEEAAQADRDERMALRGNNAAFAKPARAGVGEISPHH